MLQGSKVETVLEAIKELMDQMKSDQKVEDIEYANVFIINNNFSQRAGVLFVEIEILEYTLGKL